MRKTRPESSAIGFMLAMIVATGLMADVAGAASEKVTAPGFAWRDGAEVYAKVCAYCHEGGPVGPQIRGRDLPTAYIRTVVRNGFRAMPPFRAAEIDDASLAKLAEYISKN
jgi:mono/diheme cytochrome c family protein